MFLNGLLCSDTLEKGLMCCIIFSELYRGAMTSSMERDFGRGDIGINRGFGDSFGRLGRLAAYFFSFCRLYFSKFVSLFFCVKNWKFIMFHNITGR